MFFLLTICLTGCRQSNPTVTVKKPSKVETKKAPIFDKWYDPIIAQYIQDSKKDLIVLERKSNTNIEWLLDRSEKSDTATYFIFEIGHEVNDDGQHFTADGWVYLDSIQKRCMNMIYPMISLSSGKSKFI